jgi:two-component system sensor histidine kinase UhpB
MLAIIEHLQAINRSMLDRLRPMALGHVPLQELLDQLVRDRSRQHPQIAFSFAAGKVHRGYGDSIDLTVFRCVQESLTNAIRHAQAKTLTVELSQTGDDAELELTVRDDGIGMGVGAPPGFGIRGMQERVEGLGGHFAIENASGGGTCVRVVVPLLEHRPAPSLAADAGDGARA